MRLATRAREGARPLVTLALVASLLPLGAGCHGAKRARDGGRWVDEDRDDADVPRLPAITPREDAGDGPTLDVGAFAARFPRGYPEPKRSVRELREGTAVSFVSATADGVCLVLGTDQERGGDDGAPRSLRSFERGLVGEKGRLEGASSFRYAGLEARTAMFTSRDSGGERTYWRYLAVVDGPRLFAAIFMSKREPARREPAVDRFLGSLRIGKGAMPTGPTGPETPDGPKGAPTGPGEIKI